jgi:hypothetical protein
MNKKLCISLIVCAAIVAVAINLPKLPSTRYTFKAVEKKDAYSNLHFSTMVYDSWTSEVKYVAYGRFGDEDAKVKPTFEVSSRVLNEGVYPAEIVSERYALFFLIGLLAGGGILYLVKGKE